MNDSQLDHLLKSCGSCPTPPGFSSEVWNRIAAEPDSVGWLSAGKQFLAETFARLAQPSGALAASAIFVIAGILAGFGSRPEAQPPELQYVRSVSPFITHSGQ
jgi:hypothetical protein